MVLCKAMGEPFPAPPPAPPPPHGDNAVYPAPVVAGGGPSSPHETEEDLTFVTAAGKKVTALSLVVCGGDGREKGGRRESLIPR